MYQESIEDTIVAVSTPPGKGGIGIVRLSGKESLEIIDKIFIPKGKQKPRGFKSHTIHYGTIADSGKGESQDVDEALVMVMRGPKSYTREDVVEINSHGGTVSLKRILNLVLDQGARLAQPGEFTKRAFLSGRIDLTQAEAVLDIIQAKTEAFLRTSVNQLKGDLAIEIESIRESLMDTYVEVEAIINFPEDDVEVANQEKLKGNIFDASKRVEKLLSSSEQGRIMREGAKIVICGKPNVGKSSLLNVLLKQPRAIVSEVKGTTRDTIEESAQVKGIPLQLVDTAGILNPRDSVEEEAVRRSHLNIDQADLVIFMLDSSEAISKEDREIIEKVEDKNIIIVFNKCDCKICMDFKEVDKIFENQKKIQISALKRQGIDILEEEIVKNIMHGKDFLNADILISNLRQIESLKKCFASLKNAQEHLSGSLSLEFISEDIKAAVSHLDNITGKNITQDLLDKIFSSFCIGK